MVFLPRQAVFYDQFNSIHEELNKLVILFAEFSENFNNFEHYATKAKLIESAADDKTHAIIEKLNKTFITPFDREDIYLLAHELDDVVDLIQHTINNIYLYKVTKRIEAMSEFSVLITKASYELGVMLNCLKQKKNSELLKQTKIKIHALEDAGDNVFSKAMTKLFEKTTDPVELIKHKDILESLEHVMDKFQKVSDIIEGIMVKSS